MYFRKNNDNRVVSLNDNHVQDIIQEAALEENTVELQKMMIALKQLDDSDIQLIELRFFEKRSFAEVAQIIGVTENNAKVKVYRILDKLKKVLGKKGIV
jgi:RNA polymerase sigma-70 factor (ECF subfamily)